MGIDVLGPLTIEGDQKVLGRRDRVVVAALAVHPGEVVSAEQLADVLWGEQLPPSWPKVVQGCVVRLRKVLGVHAIETLPLGYRLAVPLDEIDAQRFERSVGRARELLAADDPERSALVLADALKLWRGHPLTELDGWDPARIEASRLTELRHTANELYVESALRSGQHDRVLDKAQTLVAEAPLRERRWVLLATAQYQAGRQGEALRTIQRLRAVLNRQLGLDPNADVDALEQAILRQDPSLVAESALPEPSAMCPYPGLKPYDLDDADGFFGRDSDIAACLRKLADNSVLAVVGPSGCGKSSLARAGVAAALRRDGKRVVVITPGTHPVAALAAAMPGSGPAPALLVDQCEEVFSLCEDAAERDTFLTALCAHQAVAPLIMSFRADRLADISSHPPFARVVEQGLYLLSGMSQTDLRSAIEEPARLASLVVEPGLVDLLVNEVADQPGALPLMSHALSETWQRREGRTLTVAGYNASGGIRGAVAQSAEQVYERIPPEQRVVLRDLLLRLVIPGAESEPVRSRLPRRLVVTGPEDDAMIDLLVGSRLVISDAGVVELAHESMVRAWPRLREWLEDDLDGQRILHHLAVAADSWNTLDRPDSELYRGGRLAKALDWQELATPTLTATEEAFLAASKRLSQSELRAAEAQARQRLHIIRRLRAALAAAAVLLVGALITGSFAVYQADRADQAATSVLAGQAAARALVTEGVSHSILLAAQAVRLDNSAETRTNLMAAMNKRPLLLRSMSPPAGHVQDLELSPDGSRIVAGDLNATFHLYDTGSGRVLVSHPFGSVTDGRPIYPTARFSADGRLVAAIVPDESGTSVDPQWPLRLLNADTLEPVTPQPVLPQIDGLRISSLAFSADGRYLAAGGLFTQTAEGDFLDSPVGLVWDVQAVDRPPRRVVLPGAGLANVLLSPDGRTLYAELPIGAYDVATGRQKWQRPSLYGTWVFDLAERGDVLAFQELGPDPSDVPVTTLADARTGKTISALPGTVDTPRSVAFVGDGKLLATAQSTGEIILWDVATGTPREHLKTAEGSWSVAFSPDTRTLYTVGDESMLRVYDLAGQRQFLPSTQAAPARRYLHVVASDNGQSTVYLWREGKESWVSIADAATGRMTTPTRLGIDLQPALRTPTAWHPSGRWLAVHDSRAIAVVDTRTGTVLKEVGNLTDRANLFVNSIAYFDHGRRLVAGGSEVLIYFDPGVKPQDKELWATGQTVYWPTDCCMATADDGETAVLFEQSSEEGKRGWRIIHTATGALLSEGDLPFALNSATYSPDGGLIAGTGAAGGVLTIDTRSGEVKSAPTTSHTDEGVVVRFSPDGSRIVSGAANGTVSMWDARTLDLLGTVSISPEGGPVGVSPRFTGGNDIVTIAAYDGKTYEWDTRIEQTIAHACAMAGRNLTADEWSQAFGDRPYEKTCP